MQISLAKLIAETLSILYTFERAEKRNKENKIGYDVYLSYHVQNRIDLLVELIESWPINTGNDFDHVHYLDCKKAFQRSLNLN
jgi:hypothetical protein